MHVSIIQKAAKKGHNILEITLAKLSISGIKTQFHLGEYESKKLFSSNAN